MTESTTAPAQLSIRAQLKEITMGDTYTGSYSWLQDYPALRAVTIPSVNESAVGYLKDLPKLRHLGVGDSEHPHGENAEDDAERRANEVLLENLPSTLRSLSVSLTDMDLEFLGKFPELEELDLHFVGTCDQFETIGNIVMPKLRNMKLAVYSNDIEGEQRALDTNVIVKAIPAIEHFKLSSTEDLISSDFSPLMV